MQERAGSTDTKTRWALWLATMCLVIGAGCSSSPETGVPDGGDAAVDTTPGDTTEGGGDTENEADVVSCEAGEVIRCSEENTQSIVVCKDDGTGTEPASCPPNTVCRDAECVEVACVPGRGRCDGDTPQVCNESGEQFVDKEPCGEGSQCENGSCLNRCELAAKTNSYIGCEYWAVELENHLLYDARDTGQAIPDDKLPPYALVIANPSDEYNAKVSVWKDADTPAKAVGSRQVETDVRTPDVVLKTVYSELVSADGRRLMGPIDREIEDIRLPKNSLLTLILPNRQLPHGQTTVTDFAYRVESTQPVIAYQFNPYCCNYNYTNDASLLLPTSALTENYMYLGYPNWDNPEQRMEGEGSESATLSVLATQKDTQVTVQLRKPNKEGVDYRKALYPISGRRIEGPDNEGRLKVTLQPHEVLNVAGKEVGVDMTGSRITADKPVSVFGAHSCTFVPFANWACDHLESQLFPMETWGNRFVAAPLKMRLDTEQWTREGTYWKFLAREDDTRVKTGLNLQHGPQGVLPPAAANVPSCQAFTESPEKGTFVLDAGESCEFGTKELFVAEADRPIMMGAFLSGQQSVGGDVEKAGDPAFFLVPPREQYRNSYAFLTPETYAVDYVTVTLPVGFTKLTLDGEEIDIKQADSFKEYSELGFARAHIKVEPGPHTIESGTVPFGIVAYGYHDYVSYAYTGGLDLAKRSPVGN